MVGLAKINAHIYRVTLSCRQHKLLKSLSSFHNIQYNIQYISRNIIKKRKTILYDTPFVILIEVKNRKKLAIGNS